MSKIVLSTAALALAAVLTAAAPAGAAERRADGLRNSEAAPTEFSSHRRRYFHRGPRYGYWGPRYRSWGPGYGYYGPSYAYAGYPYYYRPWRPYPVVSFGFGFGPRWGW